MNKTIAQNGHNEAEMQQQHCECNVQKVYPAYESKKVYEFTHYKYFGNFANGDFFSKNKKSPLGRGRGGFLLYC